MPESTIGIPATAIILIIIFVIAAAIGTGIGQEIFRIINQFVGGNNSTLGAIHEDYVSFNSVDALVCAINSVANDKKEDCTSKFKEPVLSLSGSITGEQSGLSDVFDNKPDNDDGFVFDENELLPEERAWIECGGSGSSFYCDVNNFNLPQYVPDSENYIAQYGDPRYLVYWNIFPMSEDTWDYEIDWLTHVAIFAIALIPPTKVGKVGMSTVWAGLKGPAKEVVEDTLIRTWAREITEKQAKEAVEYYSKHGGKKALKQLFYKVSASTQKEFMKETARASLKKTITERFSKRGITRLVVAGGVLEGAAAVSALVDSMNMKNEPVGNAIALKKSLEIGGDMETFDIPDQWKDKPIILKSVPGLTLTKNKPFHLVSPCYLDSFRITKEPFICGIYSNNPSEQNSYCMEPEQDFDSDLLICGIIDNKIDSHFGHDGLYDILQDHKSQQERKIFQFDEEHGYNDRVYFPWIDPNVFLDLKNIELTTDGLEYKIYTTNLYYETDEQVSSPEGSKNEIIEYIGTKLLQCFNAFYGENRHCNTIETSKLEESIEITNEEIETWLRNSGGEAGLDLLGVGVFDRNNLIWETEKISKDSLYFEIMSSKEGRNGIHVREIETPAFTLGTTKIYCQMEQVYNKTKRGFDYVPNGRCGGTIKSDNEKIKIESTQIELVGDQGEEDVFRIANSVSYYIDYPELLIHLTDNDDDQSWDEIGVTDKGLLHSLGLTGSEKNSLLLSEVDKDGTAGHVTMTNCQTEGISVDISDFNNQRNKNVDDKNYCFYHESAFTSGLKVSGQVVGVAGALASLLIFKNPQMANSIAWVVLVGSAGYEAVSGVTVQYKKSWPGPTGS